MNQEYVTALVRHIGTAVGGFLVARGITDNTTVETIIGGVVAAIGLGWSLYHKKTVVIPNQPTAQIK